jgi:hypothetical protein
MTIDTPVIIEAAINGGSSKRRNPNVPREPSEIIEDTFTPTTRTTSSPAGPRQTIISRPGA